MPVAGQRPIGVSGHDYALEADLVMALRRKRRDAGSIPDGSTGARSVFANHVRSRTDWRWLSADSETAPRPFAARKTRLRSLVRFGPNEDGYRSNRSGRAWVAIWDQVGLQNRPARFDPSASRDEVDRCRWVTRLVNVQRHKLAHHVISCREGWARAGLISLYRSVRIRPLQLAPRPHAIEPSAQATGGSRKLQDGRCVDRG
jgi:hypothetical protein